MKQKNETTSSCKRVSKTNKDQHLFKFDFSSLPNNDVKFVIDSHLEPTEHTNLSLTSQKNFKLFKPNFKAKLLNALLSSVSMGKQCEAEKLLQISPELMLEKVNFTDSMNRTFLNISAFEWVLWAWDTRYMVNMMFKCLPDDEKGLDLVNQLKNQYELHQKNGITYVSDNQTIREKHFNFSPLIDALEMAKARCDKWELSERKTHWSTVIGKIQRTLPIYILQNYCDPTTPFYPTPKFDAETFVRVLSFSDCLNKKDAMTWEEITQSETQTLGIDCAIARHCADRSVSASWFHDGVAQCDINALQALFAQRKTDYLLIIDNLESLYKEKECKMVGRIQII